MVTICVLCGCIGHFIGASGRPSRTVCSTLYPPSGQRATQQPIRAIRDSAQRSSRATTDKGV